MSTNSSDWIFCTSFDGIGANTSPSEKRRFSAGGQSCRSLTDSAVGPIARDRQGAEAGASDVSGTCDRAAECGITPKPGNQNRTAD